MVGEFCSNLVFGSFLMDEEAVDPPHHGDLLRWTRHEHHTVGLNAFLLTRLKLSLWFSNLINEQPPQSVAGGSSLSEPQFHKFALPLKYFCG